MSNDFIPVWGALDDGTLKQAVEGGLNIDVVDRIHGVSLLWHLCTDKDAKIEPKNMDNTRELIAEGANVNITNDFGKPLLHAVKDPEIVKLLIDGGVDVNAKDSRGQYGKTLLQKDTDPEIIKLLIEAGADANKGSSIGEPTSKTVVQDDAAAAQVAGQAAAINVGRK